MGTGKLIKVCKIDSINFASYAIKQGIDFLGIHVLSEKDIGNYLELTKYIRSEGGKPVVLTKVSNVNIITEIIELYDPFGLQLHFDPDFELTTLLKNKFPSLALFGVITDETNLKELSTIEPLFDYVIYDTSYVGGTGKKNQLKLLPQFSDVLKSKTLFAGGITIERIKELLPLKPAGFDIQSFFRLYSHRHFRRLEEVCDFFNFPRHSKISVSLTDLPLKDITKISSYYIDPNIEYHLDYSLGDLYANFITISNSIEEKCNFLSQYPFSLHLFLKSEKLIVDSIIKYERSYRCNLTRIIIQYYKELRLEDVMKAGFIKKVVSIYYKDLHDYIGQNYYYPFISVVLPANDKQKKFIELVDFMNENEKFFQGKEVWLDRNLTEEDIQFFRSNLTFKFNVIVGKEIIGDWKKISVIHEYLS